MSQTPDNKGYLSVELCGDKRRKRRKIHRLVAIAFIPNPENKPIVDHIDFDVSNNAVTNLRWFTDFENQAHRRNPDRCISFYKRDSKYDVSIMRHGKTYWGRFETIAEARAYRDYLFALLENE